MSNNNFSSISTNWLVLHVPVDVWRSIFEICLIQDLSHRHSWLPQPKCSSQAPLLLGHVCSAWRDIVLSAPDLWNHISFLVDISGRPSPHPKLVGLFLEHARGVPLKISLWTHIPYSDLKDVSSVTSEVIRVLMRNFYRTDKLDIQIDLLLNFLEELPQDDTLTGGMPLLQTLIFRGGEVGSIDPRLSRLWSRSPELRSLEFGSSVKFDYSYAVNTLLIPFAQLTHLHIASYIYISQFCDLLFNCQNLVSCEVGFLYWDPGYIIEPITLSSLQRLSVGTTDAPPIFSFILSFAMPALTTLDLYDDSGKDWPHGTSASFFARSSPCSIQHLSFDTSQSNSPEKLDFLRLLPQLTSLAVRTRKKGYFKNPESSHDFNKILIRELGSWHESRKEFTLLPRLQKIVVDYDFICPEQDSESTVFAHMVEDRQLAVEVNLDTKREKDGNRWAICRSEIWCLRVLEEKGFDVTLKWT